MTIQIKKPTKKLNKKAQNLHINNYDYIDDIIYLLIICNNS